MPTPRRRCCASTVSGIETSFVREASSAAAAEPASTPSSAPRNSTLAIAALFQASTSVAVTARRGQTSL